MQKGWFVALVFLTLLVAPSVLADCYEKNFCDPGYETRYLDATGEARDYYLSKNSAFDPDGKPSHDAYPAALFYASQVETQSRAETILSDELAKTHISFKRTHQDNLYLAWALVEYSDAFSPGTITAAEAALVDYISTSTTPSKLEDKLFQHVTIYLGDEQSNKATLITLLRTKGDNGWDELENNPTRLAKIVTSLAALFDAAPDDDVRKLAEMNLDLIFTRFAASSVNGAWVSPTAGNRLSTSDTPRTPWYGWSHLLFATSDGSTVEPSVLVSNYCAHVVTQAISLKKLRVLDETSDGAALATVATDSYTLGAARDGSTTYDPADGYVTKAALRFTDYLHFIDFNSRTCPELTDDQEDDLAETFLVNDRIVLGNLDTAMDCGEPHAFFGVGLDWSYIYDDETPQGVIVTDGNKHVIIYFLGSVLTTPVHERYANRSNHLPQWLKESEVIFPTGTGPNRGMFSLEVASDTFVGDAKSDDCLAEFSEIECVAAAAADKVSLEYVEEEIVYTSVDSNGQPIIYTYEPGGPATNDGNVVSTTNHAFRYIVDIADPAYDYLEKSSDWVLKAQYSTHAAIINLNFAAETIEEMKTVSDATTYGCDDASPPTNTGLDPVFSKLGFAATSFLKVYEDDDYILDCAPGTDVFPNKQLYPEGILEGACLLRSGDKRVIALALKNDSTGNPLHDALDSLNLYFPYITNNKLNFSDDDLNVCDDAWVDTYRTVPEGTIINDYKDCAFPIVVVRNGVGLPTHNPLYAWVNGGHKILVISTDRNPFTNGWWSDTFGDWFANLFSGTVEGPEPGEVQNFDAAYFLKEDEKELRAVLVGTEAELVATNLVQSLKPMADKYASDYVSTGTSQHISFFSTDAAQGSAWALYTRALRISDVDCGGSCTPFTSQADCNGVPIDYLPECDPDEVTPCPNDPSRNITCTNACRLDDSECGICVDLDGDGDEVCGDIVTDDCRDYDKGTFPVKVEGEWTTPCGEITASDCETAPLSACPQCVRHSTATSIVEDICCDNVDNDCDGINPDDLVPPVCQCGSGSGEEPREYRCADVSSLPPGGDEELTSNYGLTCDHNYSNKLKVGTLGTYTLREYYTKVESPFSQLGDRAIVLSGSDNSAACFLFGHSNQWQIRAAPTMHYPLDLTSYYDGHSQVTVSWPYPIWTSVLGGSGAAQTYRNPLQYQSPTPNVYVQVKRQDYGDNIEWSLKATVNAAATQEELGRFVDCWYDGDLADIKTSGTFDRAKIQTWANTAFPAFNDTMAMPCEDEPGDPIIIPSDCPDICAIIPECELECDTTNCNACAIAPGCVPDTECPDLDDCGARASCASDANCLAGQVCSAGCCFTRNTGGGGNAAGCFSLGTPVSLADGSTKAIEAIAVGDELLVYDETNERITTDVVTERLVHPGKWEMLLLNDYLEVTRRHHIFSSQGWIPAEELAIGDSVRSAEGWLEISSIAPFSLEGTVYNLHLSTHHNYFAGGLLVHNILKQ